MLDMPDQEGAPENTKDLVAEGFLQQLRAAVANAGIEGKEDFERVLGFSYSTYNRLEKNKDLLSLKAAITAYQNLKRHLRAMGKAFDVAPPAMPIQTRDEYRWLRVGQRLMAADKDEFANLMKMASDALDIAEARKRLEDRANRLRDPSLSDPDANS